jgi:hypothetical protein
VKSAIRQSRASGSTLRKIEKIVREGNPRRLLGMLGLAERRELLGKENHVRVNHLDDEERENGYVH